MTATPRTRQTWWTIGAVAIMVAAGYATISATLVRTSPRLLPWVLGRGFGVAGYLSLTALTMVGLWLRHPWRFRRSGPSPQTLNQVHSTLASLTLLMIAGHITALSLDRYAGVGWGGAFIPGRSHYRPIAVALGTLSLYSGLAVGLTAALAGWLGGRAWLSIHRFACLTIAMCWVHAVLAGSDERFLFPMYLVTATAVVLLFVTRRLARPVPSMAPPLPQPRSSHRALAGEPR